MRMVFGLVLLVGVALAGGAVYMAKNYIGAYQNELARERASRQEIIPTVDVYVAQRSLKYGEALNSDDFRLVAWPETAIPEGTFVGQGSLYPEGENDLRYVLRAMEKDEAIETIRKLKERVETVYVTFFSHTNQQALTNICRYRKLTMPDWSNVTKSSVFYFLV